MGNYKKVWWFFETMKKSRDLYLAAAEANKFPIFKYGLFGELMKSKKRNKNA